MPTATEQFTESLLAWAGIYADAGLPVFPVYGPFKKHACQCRKGAACERAAKHPVGRLVPNGLLDASTDPERISTWWRAWPRANVGIAVPAGYVVLDVDGLDGLEAIAAEGWTMPRTVTAATGRGWHHWFRADVEIRPGSDFMPHVDMRGPGGYVIAPPSLHESGTQYDWEHSPLEVEFAPAPDWIYELVSRARDRHQRATNPSEIPDVIGEHSRNDTLTRIAGAMRRYGCSERAILGALEVTNEERCRPMLEDDELAVIASSVARYAPEQIADRPGWEPYGWESQAW